MIDRAEAERVAKVWRLESYRIGNETYELGSLGYHLAGRKRTRTNSSVNRVARDAAVCDLGLVKVRGAMGGTYYE